MAERPAGRQDDTVDTHITFARVPLTGAGGNANDTARTLPLFTPARPLRVYITSDSLVTDPAASFQDLAGQSRVINVLSVDPHAATGLAQPEIFDWFDYLPQQARQLRPNLVVITLGGNDGLDLSGADGGQSFGSAAWRAEYARRAGGVMDDFISVGAKVVWLGLPISRESDLAAPYRVINQVDSEQARLRAGNVTFVDLYRRFADKNGQYSDYLPGVGGRWSTSGPPTASTTTPRAPTSWPTPSRGLSRCWSVCRPAPRISARVRRRRPGPRQRLARCLAASPAAIAAPSPPR